MVFRSSGSGGGAGLGSQYLTLAADPTLTQERILTAGGGVTLADGGAGGAATLGSSWAGLDKTGSSLADLATRSASDLASGNLAYARMPTASGVWSIGTVANAGVTLSGTDGVGFVQFVLTNTAAAGGSPMLREYDSTAIFGTSANWAFLGSGGSSGSVAYGSLGAMEVTFGANNLPLLRFGASGTTIGAFGVTPVARPLDMGAFTSNGVSANHALIDVTTAAVADPGKINANFDDVADGLNLLRNALRDLGWMT